VGRDFVTRGVKRVVRLFRKRWSIERLFSRAKEWLLLDGLRVRGLSQVSIHVALSLGAMLAVAVAAVGLRALVWLGDKILTQPTNHGCFEMSVMLWDVVDVLRMLVMVRECQVVE